MGVGSAVSESFVRGIAEATGGAAELVSPREDMAERIVRHFRRIDQPRARSARIEWPIEPISQTPARLESVFAGDTLHVFGWFCRRPVGAARLSMVLEDGREVLQEARLCEITSQDDVLVNDLPRVGAHARLAEFDPIEATALAEHYQLVSEYTSCILVYDREKDQKSGEIPALRKVPHALAAGWGGMGSVHGDSLIMASSSICLDISASASPADESRAVFSDHLDLLEAPDDAPSDALPGDFGLLITALNQRYPATSPARLDIQSIDELLRLGLKTAIADALKELVKNGEAEHVVVLAFLSVLVRSSIGASLSHHVKRVIHSAENSLPCSAPLEDAVARLALG